VDWYILYTNQTGAALAKASSQKEALDRASELLHAGIRVDEVGLISGVRRKVMFRNEELIFAIVERSRGGDTVLPRRNPRRA
jgi:hypothetical protein